jgi:hypothetical protein
MRYSGGYSSRRFPAVVILGLIVGWLAGRLTRACSRPPTVPLVEGSGACIALLGEVHWPPVALSPAVVKAYRSYLACFAVLCVTAVG